MLQNFGDRLADAVRSRKSPVCVGLDPRWQSLPDCITAGVDPRDKVAVARRTAQFCCEVIDAVAAVAPVVKPQAAFFEQLGAQGMLALEKVIEHAKRSGLLVLLDGKRGDIGTTAEAYADAYLGGDSSSGWGCDALTVNPFLGDDTLEPFVQCAQNRGAGIFVLVKTSNPGSGFLQDRITDGQSIYQIVADAVQSRAVATAGESGYGSVGAVVGATFPEQLAELRQRMPSAWILIPGYGAQGGTAQDVAHGFDRNGLGAIVNSSRGIIFAFRQLEIGSTGGSWQDAVNASARQMSSELLAALDANASLVKNQI